LKIHYTYHLRLRPEPEGGYTVIVPSLPGCITYGKDAPEALAMGREAIEGYIECLKDKGEEIPTDEGILEYTMFIEMKD
jgi:antitoxin HicB